MLASVRKHPVRKGEVKAPEGTPSPTASRQTNVYLTLNLPRIFLKERKHH